MSLRATERSSVRSVADEPLISVGEAALDRMPALVMICEAAAENFTRELEETYEAPATMAVEDLRAKRASDLPPLCEKLTHVFLFEAQGLASKIAVAIDDEFCDLGVELLLGSGAIGSKMERARSKIDLRLAAFLIEKMLRNLARALEPVATVRFERDLSTEEAGLAALGQKSAVMIVGNGRLTAFERIGSAAIIIPRAALDPYRAALSRMPGGEGIAHDERWSENLYKNVVRTEVKVDVKIEARNFTLGDIANLEIGDVLRLPISPTCPIRIESEGRTLFWCTLGQKDGYYTVRLEEFSDARQSFVENILGV